MITDTIRVLCADDHALIREGIASLISNAADMALVAEASNGEEAIQLFQTLRPDVVLMDLKMPVMNGIDAIKRICGEFPEARIIVLTTYGGDVLAQRALSAGAKAYLVKGEIRKDLIQRIRDIHKGETRVNDDVALDISKRNSDDNLSLREVTVLGLIAAGQSNKAIGTSLSITEGTVKNHVKNILSKLDASDRTQAVMFGLERGIIGV